MNNLPSNDFDLLVSFLHDEKCVNIDQWQQVNNFESLKHTKKSECDFANKGGVYAIMDADDHVAYIGKAKCLYDRLHSHSWALVGRDKVKAPSWDQFFTHPKCKNMRAKYFVVDRISTLNAEYARQVIERSLQIKYQPIFDRIYDKRKVRIEDFDERFDKIKISLNMIRSNSY